MAMNFWAIGCRYEKDVFYDFLKHEDVFHLSETCFLPTYEMAEQFIEDVLSIDYIPVLISLESLNKEGIWSYFGGPVDEWDWEEDMEDEE